MKRFLSLMVALVLVFGVVQVSQAKLQFDYHGNEKKDFKLWTNLGESEASTDSGWHLSWLYYGLGPTYRAVVRVYTTDGKIASSAWVYDHPSTKHHPYKKAIKVGTQVVLKGRMDNRDNGWVDAGGYIHP